MTSCVKRVGDLTDPERFEKAVEEANKNGEVRSSCEKGAKRLKEDAHGF